MNDNLTLNQAKPEIQRKFITGVYVKMVFALALTTVSAFFVAFGLAARIIPFQFFKTLVYSSFIAELVIVLVLSYRVRKLSPLSALFLFILYSVLNGVSFASIFLIFELGSVVKVFACTTLMFLGMSIYGAFTKSDLRAAGRYLVMGLIGLCVATLLNLFFKSSAMDWLLSLLGIGIFVGLTAYDTQKILTLSFYDDGSKSFRKYEVIGALELYLDFINIFIRLLSLFGRKK